MEKEKKKKKLTLSVSSKRPHNAPHFSQSRGKTSVVIEKKGPRRWPEKKFQKNENKSNFTKNPSNFASKKPQLNRNFDIRKLAEERATRRFKNLKDDTSIQKKTSPTKEKGFVPKREKKLTLSKVFDDEALDGRERSLASVKRARLKEKKNQELEKKKIETKKIVHEVNIPDNIEIHTFTLIAVNYKFRSTEEFDISDSNDSYRKIINYNLTTNSWENGNNGTIDGTLDNLNENNDARMFIEIETYNFGYLKSYSWKFNNVDYQISYNFDPTTYSFYKSQPHLIEEYEDYISFVTIDELAIIEIGLKLREISQEKGFDNLTEVNFVMSFTQSLKYSEDNVTSGVGEYPRYPIETLIDQTGDCEDTSALLISLLESLGYEAAMILIPEAWDGYGHAAVGVSIEGASGVNYILNEKQDNEVSYYYAETTAPGWKLGEIPDLDSNEAYVYEV